MVLRQLHNTIVVGGCQMKNEKKYNIGLDIGTTSVGWAVVESNHQKIMRKGNKPLWGVRLFEEANSAASRRSFRSTRRRYDRRRERIRLLQEEFKEEINKADSTFFQKLKESFYQEDDTINKTVPLIEEEKEKVREYHQKYKTIYHLRNELITNSEQKDIRLVYLAIHHMIKYRGNFLYTGSFSAKNINLKGDLIHVLETLSAECPELELSEDFTDFIDIETLVNAILNPSKNDRKVDIEKSLSNILSKDFTSQFIKMVNGSKFDFLKMIHIDSEDKVELSFNGSEYEDKYDEFEKILDDKIAVLDSLKSFYNSIFLKRLFGSSENVSLSAVMCEKYSLHEKDLRNLKQLFRPNKKLYYEIFKTKKEKCLYEKYISNDMSYDEFIKSLEKLLENLFDTNLQEDLTNMYQLQIKPRIENGIFLPRITDKDNGKYPYQLNQEELRTIIENQGKYYPFLLEKVGSMYKIEKLLTFRIPYYVGPLVSSNKSDFAWMTRKIEHEKITPYNFDEIIDKEKTAEDFIKRMISHCTYLLDEYALPNQSILYSKFKVMNELKQIRVNGEKLTNEQQQDIIQNLFMKASGTITDKKFKEYLYANKDFDMYGTDISVTGYSSDNRFANHMQSYIDFFGPNGIFSGTDYNEEDADEIIEWITIFEDKDILKAKVEKAYPDLSNNSLKQILAKKYSGWGNLSKKLLTGIYYKDKKTGIPKSILDLMRETDKNFMQILFEKEYELQDRIDEENKIDTSKRIDYSLVEDLATSPATKRGIYQALRVVEEIVDYIGYEPEAIMVEMARGDEKKERKDDRKKYLSNLYEKGKQSIENYQALKKELNEQAKIDSQKLFLYFIQEGKSLYSGKPLDILNLDSYEIDHIIPRTLIKDDSIDNKALVFRDENQIKGASYVLPREYRTDVNIAWWEHLKKIGLISAKKFHNLRRSVYKEEELEGFINRQLVETRQISKHVANILKNYHKDSNIIYLHANLSHHYRDRYQLFKFRNINDYHHAHDAYLAAVLGEYKEKYLRTKITFEQVKELNQRIRNQKDYQKLRYGYVINSLDSTVNGLLDNVVNNVDEETGEILFDAEKFNKIVEDTLYRNDILISKKTEIRTGEFYNQTKSKKGGKGVSLKGNLPTDQYGSYTSLNPAYASLARYTYKGKEKQKLIGIPIYVVEKEKTNPDFKLDYVRNLLGLSENDMLEISDKKVPMYSLLDWNGQSCYLVGASDVVEVCNAKEFHFNKDFMMKNKFILNKLFNQKNIEVPNYEDGLNDCIQYIVEKIEKEYLLYQNLIDELKQMIHYDNLNSLSIEEKEQTIIQLLALLKCDSQTANFKFLDSNYSSAFGKRHRRTISEGTIINKSVSGIKEEKESIYEF